MSKTSGGILQHQQKKQKPTKRTWQDTIDDILAILNTDNMTLGEMEHHLFRAETSHPPFKRSESHKQYISKFLRGHAKIGVGQIVKLWMGNPFGKDSSMPMYSLETPYQQILPAHAALMAFAAQNVEEELIREATKATDKTSSLRVKNLARTSGNQIGSSSGTDCEKLSWSGMGSTTMSDISDTVRQRQPLMYKLCLSVATPKARKRNGVMVVRSKRPAELITLSSITALDFSRSWHSQKHQLTSSIYDFALGVPHDLFTHNSRKGTGVAYSTVYRSLLELSAQEAVAAKCAGRDLESVGVLTLDNVQHHHKHDVRYSSMGMTDQMVIGVAGTYAQLHGIDVKALNLEDKAERQAKSERRTVNTNQLLDFVNHAHVDNVFATHWILLLVNEVPQLHHLKDRVSEIFRTRCAIKPLPAKANKVYPLAPVSKNETVTTELKDTFVDMLAQLGQLPEDFDERLLFTCGDGLTYDKTLQLQKYLQDHDTPFEKLEILQPLLALWHTLWTDLSRLVEHHWGDKNNNDPSTLGHNAAKIGRPTPSDLKKVDFYPGMNLVTTVLKARTLDCWGHILGIGNQDLFRHFEELEKKDELPTFEDLEALAQKLHHTYSSTRGLQRACRDVNANQEWANTVPEGSPVQQPADSKSDFAGDMALARSIAFIRDALVCYEASYAAAEGDVGRVYEMLKLMLFTFAGSSHSKYVNYLLESIVSAELESSPELHDAMLTAMLVNLTGQPGHFMGLDFMQEYFNRLLQTVVQRKGQEYGDTFVRDVVSRNLYHFSRLKAEFATTVALYLGVHRS
ncbi:hypothetical protein CONPUDRAFT_137143 [Coniophora puteana RWD-64-598 SS2]|uniref:DUF6589 domain-containing protein n=1 Tax=Coniophora puteana (strain RWD-64-598) TaxID=741705 RepID=A0A5M3MPD3_CONPW|nr:uncharacterized protein CONPUDRAFT_137143 [Coniophora puteana RWD-64-598 SS2]EIW81039.1 hypothetical protein CONPUDRAFT_137143 [Coniophora puteana RWD-64-598 SS2]